MKLKLLRAGEIYRIAHGLRLGRAGARRSGAGRFDGCADQLSDRDRISQTDKTLHRLLGWGLHIIGKDITRFPRFTGWPSR